jgi:Uma2 family endonuclease
MPEGNTHRRLSNLLYQSVEREFAGRAIVSSDQLLYWDPTDPKKSLAPDLTVRIGAAPQTIVSWKTWELGAPHVGVEIVSEWDRSDSVFRQKLERYRQAGISEAVRFDAEDGIHPLRLWDLFDGDLVERDLTDREALLSDALGLYWCVRQDEDLGQVLRMARDAAGRELVLTPEEVAQEAERTALTAKEAAEAAKEAAEAAKEAAEAAKEAALARVADLEAELAAKR